MATPTDDPTMETISDDNPTMVTIPDVPMAPKRFPFVGGGVVSTNFNFKVTRGLGGVVENAKVKAGKLYLRQIMTGPGTNQSDVIQRTGLGKTVVNDWGVYDGAGSMALVAKAQGMHTLAGNWNNWFTLVFEVERFRGSTLQVMGASVGEENEWAIVGGTGEFAMARGIIKRRVYSVLGVIGGTITQELIMEFFCRMTVVPAPIKRGPWGGNGGSLREMEGKSQRLENMTIYHIGAVEGIQFSYVNEAGEIRTTGIWGHVISDPVRTTEIKFGPSEFVKQINGAMRLGSPWLSKFEIVTNHKRYGPFGFDAGAPLFSYTVPEGQTVVGFFAYASELFIHTIGVYTI